jgi:hypothetical protein
LTSTTRSPSPTKFRTSGAEEVVLRVELGQGHRALEGEREPPLDAPILALCARPIKSARSRIMGAARIESHARKFIFRISKRYS